MRALTALAVLSLFTAGCGLPVKPGMGPTSPVAGGHSVRYEVTCRECRVLYTDGRGGATEEDMKGSWAKTVSLGGAGFQEVMLQAIPSNLSIRVMRARISLEGRPLATYGLGDRGTAGEAVALTARLVGEELP